MAYSTPEDMMDLFGAPEMTQLSNLDNPGAQGVDEFRVETAIESADSLIDSYLSAQIDLPLPEASDPDNYAVVRRILKSKSMDIARYILESRGEPRPDVKLRYDMAIDWLKMVAKGEIEIKASSTENEVGPDAGAGNGDVLFASAPRVFTRQSLAGYTENWGRWSAQPRD